MIAGPDLAPPEWNTLHRMLRQPQPALAGIRTKGMTAARATAYLHALQARAGEAEREANDKEDDIE